MNQIKTIKPQLGFSTIIDSLHSLRQFSMKSPKSLFKLKIIKQFTQDDGFHNEKIKFHKLLQLSSSLKSLKYLDLSSSNTRKFKFSHLKLILKKFYHIQRYSAPWKNKTNKGLVPAFLLIKNAKYLTNLSIEVSLNHLPRRLLYLLHLSKIKTLHLNQTSPSGDETEISVDLSKYLPLTLENLDLRPYGPTATKWRFPLSIKHLSNIKKLELGIPLSLSDLEGIIRSIQDPKKLKSLRFNIKQEHDEEEGISKEIRGFLRRCLNLEELNIKATMADFYSETYSMAKLKRLVILQTVKTSECILRLGEFIKQQRENLESLSLKLTFDGMSDVNTDLNKFLGEFKPLRSLKKLVLNVGTKNLQITSSLTGLIEALNYLEELDFESVAIDFTEESLDKFFKALLQKHSQSLKSLKLALNDCSCSNIIAQTVKRLPRLGDLTLENFGIENGSNFYLDLREIVCYKNRGLNSVVLTNTKRHNKKKDGENVIKMLKDIIWKPTMKKFCYLEYWTPKLSDEFRGVPMLKLDDVLKQVYHFKYLHLPTYTCEPSFYYWDLDVHKWK